MRFLIQGCHGYDDRPYRHEKSRQNTVGFFEFGRSEWIRTTDPLHPMQMRYQAAPHSVQQEQNYNSSPRLALAPGMDLAGQHKTETKQPLDSLLAAIAA